MQTRSDIYMSPLSERYASQEMLHLFSADFKFCTWRRLWVVLAQCQQELGLPISREQIDEMELHVTDIDYRRVRQIEAETRHDVMAHVRAFGEQCPAAKPIIHLGATSAYVSDNTDLIQLREGSLLIARRIATLIRTLRDFALRYRSLATLGFTHFQPAQPTTVGKRACLWLQDLMMDYEVIADFIERLPFLGVKGATGTQASYLALFEGDHQKVKQLDAMVAKRMGFSIVLPVSGQTYPRKIDAQVLAHLSGVGQTMHKIANDLRLLQHLKEIEEPFEAAQVGSSAMPYKRNPMRAERMTALARYLITLAQSPAMTAAEQWFERTLDDSANKRLVIPEAFLTADACLILGLNVCSGLVVYPQVIRRRLESELPFMATENILMEAVKRGGDRQELHERIRHHAQLAAQRIKQEGGANDLLDRIAADSAFGLSIEEIRRIVDVDAFVGRAPQQVSEFITDYVDPLLQRAEWLGGASAATVLV